MEKSADRFRFFGKRLLNCKLFFSLLLLLNICLQLFARNPTWDELRKLKFVQGSDYFFTASDCPFYMDIYDVRPENVQVSVNYLPEDVSFVSSKKEVLMSSVGNDSYVSGTKLIVWFKFNKAGTYHLRSIDVVINGGFYRLGFDPVNVFENPRFILPKLSIQFENEDLVPSGRNKNQYTVNAGDHVIFTVYVQYAVRVNNFAWDIPENSLFKQLLQYDALSYNNISTSEFSPEKYPVATFDWQPLAKGNFELPSVYLQTTAYNGSRYDLQNPSYYFKVNPSVKKDSSADMEQESVFAYAFAEPQEEGNSRQQLVCSDADIEELVSLYHKERFSLPPFSNATRLRQQKERSLGLTVSSAKPALPVFILFLVISIGLLVGFIVLFCFKKNISGAILACVFAINCVTTIIYATQLCKTYVIFQGGELSPIPEENVSSGVKLQRGSVAIVVRRAGDWVYIKHNETFGWVLKENTLTVK